MYPNLRVGGQVRGAGMGQAVRRWLLGLGVLITGGALLAQAGMASASPAARTRAAAVARPAAAAAVPPAPGPAPGMHRPARRTPPQRRARLKPHPVHLASP